MTLMLAQETLDPLPASFWKNFCIALLVLIGAAGIVAGIIAAFRKPSPLKISDDPAIEVRKAPKRYNHDLAENRHGEVTRRLDGHDAEFEQVWQTMRNEDARIARDAGLKFDAILLALGEIKGEIKNRK
jgi:hypothetical protein